MCAEIVGGEWWCVYRVCGVESLLRYQKPYKTRHGNRDNLWRASSEGVEVLNV